VAVSKIGIISRPTCGGFKKSGSLSLPLTMILLTTFCVPLTAQSTRSLIKEGNRAYEKEDYVGAEVQYRKALEKKSDLVEGSYNLGGALYKQGKFDGSTRVLQDALEVTKSDEMKAKTFFNQGNAFFKQQLYDQSIESYINSLKLNPDDLDAKYNLLYAMKKMKKQEEQQSRRDQSPKDKEKEEGRQDQDRQRSREKSKQDSAGEKERPGQAQNEKNNQDVRDKSSPEAENRQISRAEAERILQALRDNEREVQKKLRAKPPAHAGVEKDW